MKIAIMTQPIGKNYGGIIQAFALQKVLRNMEHDVVTIDYNYQQPKFFYKGARFFYRYAKKVVNKQKSMMNIERYTPLFLQNTQLFIIKNILQSEYIDNDSDLKSNFNKNKYDAVIIGSDQTWRPKYSPNINSYYLDFLKSNKEIKKLAYASSFGVDSWEYPKKETKKCAKLAGSFDAVSVREQSGVDLCKKYLGVDSTCVLDPTLLLDKEDYLELIDDKYERGKSNGVFTYFLDENQEKYATAQLLAESLFTHTYSCQAKKHSKILKEYNLDDYIMPPVEDWLASFANAEFVLTDSFHGMVFSIIFEKPFLVIVNKERGAARFESLLGQIGGLNHLVYDPASINKKMSETKNIKPIGKEKLNILKIYSLDFLKKNL